MKLIELLQAVKEKSLSKEQIEAYRDELVSLYSDMILERAELEKQEAMFFLDKTTPQTSDISIKRAWKASPEGQRMILLTAYLKAITKVVDSLKSRIYSLKLNTSGSFACVIKDDVPWVVDTEGRLLALNGGTFVEVDRFPVAK